jgi:iron complex outermembrane receptor protein
MKIEVVSSTKFAQKQSLSPNVISVIHKDEIKKYGWVSMNDVLFKQSGFFPAQDNERITIGSRGITEGWNNNHLLLLIDGIPFNLKSYGTAITNEATPLIFTKSMEIIKGPGSALYGSYATKGVLTLNTISASDFDKNKIFASIRYGERNTAFYDVLATFKTKKIDVTTSVSYNSTDGEKYQSFDGSLEIDPITNTLKKFEPKYQRNSGYFFLKLGGKDEIKGFSAQIHSQLINISTGHGWLWSISDKNEKIQDNVNNFIIKYQKDITDKINGQFAVNYSLHNIDWNIWFNRSGAYDNWYPNGVNERLKSSFNSVFTQLQFIFKLPKKSIFVIGTEPTVFIYSGDKEHYSNIDLMNSADGYPPLTINRTLGSHLELIENKPVKYIGSFAQFSTGELFGKYVHSTIGFRYDNQFFDYYDVTVAGKPVKSKSFDDFSPRISFVITPTENFVFKIMGLTAFRAPTPTEMFGYNTWTNASNINQLQSEKIKSAEISADYNINSFINIHINTFYTITNGQIGYSLGNNNLSTNIYDMTNAGIESEILYKKNKFSAFANISYVKHLDENIYIKELDYVSINKNTLTWAPSFTANFGLAQRIKSFTFSFQGHYQDKVLRRDKDFCTTSELAAIGFTSQPRPDEVKAWLSFDLQLTYKYKFMEFGINGTNILNSDNYLVKSMKFPFDYKMEGRRISFVLNIEI